MNEVEGEEGEEKEELEDVVMVKDACEECEASPATVRCHDVECAETLCERCCQALHPNWSNGDAHDHYANGLIRPLLPTDPPGHLTIELAQVSDWPVTEKDWSLTHDLSQSRCIEAPDINDTKTKARSDWPTIARFGQNDVVVFSIRSGDDLCPGMDLASLAPACRPNWREPEAYGVVLTYTTTQRGPSVPPSRHGEGFEVVYSVELHGYVRADYTSLVKKQNRLERTDDYHVEITGGTCKPTILSDARRMAFERDIKVRDKRDELIMLSNFKIDLGDQFETRRSSLVNKSAKTNARRVVLALPEDRLSDPRDKQKHYLERKNKAVGSLVMSWYLRTMRNGAQMAWVHWREVLEQHKEMIKNHAVTHIQAHFRRYQQRHTLDDLREWWADLRYQQGRELHKGFQYVRDEDELEYAYSSNNRDFFPTVAELNKWMKVRQNASRKLVRRLQMQAHDAMRQSLRKWRSFIDSLTPSFIDIDPADEVDTTPNIIIVDHHPAKGIAHLPPLPKLWCHRSPAGAIQTEDAIKYNTIVASLAGPTPASTWVIPSLVMMGATPMGLSKPSNKTSRPAGEAILLKGIGTFICLLEDHELAQAEKGMTTSLEMELKAVHRSVRNGILGQVKSAESNYKILDAELGAYREDPKNPYRTKAVKAKRFKVRMAYEHYRNAQTTCDLFPKELHFIRYPIPHGQVPCNMTSFLLLLQDLEKRLRSGERLYLFSGEGHGRVGMLAGCLFGRVYGCPVEDTLWRLQFYHDCMRCIRERGEGSVHLSCPSNLHQAYFIRKVLMMRETEYEPMIILQGPPLDREKLRYVYSRARCVGVPHLAKEAQVMQERSTYEETSQAKGSLTRAETTGDDDDNDFHNIYL